MDKLILIVEDDPVTLQFYKYIFDFAKMKIIISEDGDEILRIVEKNNVNLIIMDINLRNTYVEGSKTDGIELSRLIKEKHKLKNIPIVLVSAYNLKNSDPESLEKSMADDYILKPISDYNKFISKIKMLIN